MNMRIRILSLSILAMLLLFSCSKTTSDLLPVQQQSGGEKPKQTFSTISMEEYLRRLLSEKAQMSPISYVREASFVDDLGYDWLDCIEMIMEIENEFGFEIPDDDAEKLTTFGAVVDYVVAKAGSTVSYPDPEVPIDPFPCMSCGGGNPGGGTDPGGSGGGGTGGGDGGAGDVVLAPGDYLCISSFNFTGGAQSSFWITNMNGLRFENMYKVNQLPGTLISLTNGVSDAAMNRVPGNDYIGASRSSLQYLQDEFPQFFASGDIYSRVEGGSTYWYFSRTAAQAITRYTLDFTGKQVALIMRAQASSPGNSAAWDAFWAHSTQLISSFIPGSTIKRGYNANAANSNAIYSKDCK